MDGFGLGNKYGSLVGLVQQQIKRYNSAQDLNGTEIKQSLEALSVCILQLFKGGIRTQSQIMKHQRQFEQKARQTNKQAKSELNGIREDVAKIKVSFNSTIESTITKFDLHGKDSEDKIEKKMQKQKQEAEVLINSGLRKLAIMQKQLEEVKQEKVSKSKILEIIKEEEEKQREREREKERQREREKERQRERQRERERERERQREKEREKERENEFLKNSGKNSWNDLEMITSLSLSWKSIKELPEKLRTLKELGQLWLNSNELTKLPQSLGNLSKLRQLAIYNNPNLKELPKSFKNLKELNKLWIDWQLLPKQNIFKTEPFTSLKNLQQLYIYNLDSDGNQRKEAIKKECEQNKIKVYF